MKCHTYRGVHIPGCWGCAVYGHRRCHCPPAPRRTTTRSLEAERDELRAALRDLRELVAAARRVNAQWPMISDAAQVEGNREAILAMADLDDALRAYDRARAAGVEVTGHDG